MRWRPRIACASSSVVPTGAVTRPSFVIASATRMRRGDAEAEVAVGEDADEPARRVGDRDAGDAVALHQRRARRRRARPASSVTGSTIIPASERLTLSTSATWSAIERFRCSTPMPPSRASAIAMPRLGDRVHRRGDERDLERDRRASAGSRSTTSFGSTADSAGTSRTSSKVRPSFANLSCASTQATPSRSTAASSPHAGPAPLQPRQRPPSGMCPAEGGDRAADALRIPAALAHGWSWRTSTARREAARLGRVEPARADVEHRCGAGRDRRARSASSAERGVEHGRRATARGRRRPRRRPTPARAAARRRGTGAPAAPRGRARSSRSRGSGGRCAHPARRSRRAPSRSRPRRRAPARRAARPRAGSARRATARPPRPSRSGSPSVSSTTRTPRRAELARRFRVERVVDAAGQRPCEDDRVGAAREVAELVHQDPELGLGDLRTPLVDLGLRPRVGSTTRVDVRDSSRMRTKSLRIASPVSSSTMRVPVRAAREPGRDDRDVEPLERARDVDPLAAREREDVARAVALTELQRRDGERAVERGVEGDGDDHGALSWDEPHEMMDGAPGDPPGLARWRAGLRTADRPRRAASGRRRATRRSRRAFRAAGPRVTGQRATAGTTTLLRERALRRRGPDDRARRDHPDGRLAPADGDRRVGARRVDDARRSGSCRGRTGAAPRGRGRAGPRSATPSTAAVIADAADARERDLRPPGERRCARSCPRRGRANRPSRLSVDSTTRPSESRRAAACRRSGGSRDRGARRGGAWRCRAQSRRGPALIQPVRVPVVRAGEPEPPRLAVHQPRRTAARCRLRRPRARSRRRWRSGRACRSGGRGR